MKTHLSFLVVAMACGTAYACGGSTTSNGQPASTTNPETDDGGATNPPPSSGDDGGGSQQDAAPPPDHGAPSNQYPAFAPDMGQLVKNGGLIMKAPIVVNITYNSDPGQAEFDAFSDAIGDTKYWSALNAEYGVGPSKSGTANHVHIADAAPQSIDDNGLQQKVIDNAGKTWPAPTDNTIYAFWLPPGTSLDFGGGQDACSAGVGGYHNQVDVNGKTTSYAVVPSCSFGGSPKDSSTMSMSHELNEAATDPQPQTNNPGLVGFDADHLAFDLFQQFQSENGDACEFFRDSFYQEQAPFPYWVQRQWSNQSAAAGHNPCVPAAPGPYFTVVPLNKETVKVDLSNFGGSSQTPTMGYHIPVGQTGTFQIGFNSDADTGGPWTIQAVEGNPAAGSKSTHLKVSVDKTSGQNGEKAYVTVTVNSAGRTKAELVTVVSTLKTAKHYMPILIGSEP